MDSVEDAGFMRLAVEQAKLAGTQGEVPVGAVVVKDGKVIGIGRNAPVASHDPTAHAEIAALRMAAQTIGNYRLDGCELYVTLEPCAMCSGAMLHARLTRVVFGAADPKTGAASSVLDVFANTQLNHQTGVQGGVLAQECGALLADFFKDRRQEARRGTTALREDALRTADERFDGLADYPWLPQYVSDLPSLDGLRLHYIDAGPADAPVTWLLLHDTPEWSYTYRHMASALLAGGGRVVAPDLAGFGKSDKPKKQDAHTATWHGQVLSDLAMHLGLRNVIAVLQEGNPVECAGIVGVSGVFVIGASQTPEPFATQAPFPDDGHRAAVRAFAGMPAADITKNWHGRLLRATDMSPGQDAAMVAMGYFCP